MTTLTSSGAYVEAQSRVQERAAHYSDRFIEIEAALKRATQEFLDTGVAIITNGLKQDFMLLAYEGDPKAYFKKVAKELGRALITADQLMISSWDQATRTYLTTPYVELTVPKSARLQNVVAGLLLVAGENGIDPHHTDRRWRFNFSGPQAAAVFEAFIEMCRTDPVMHATLNL